MYGDYIKDFQKLCTEISISKNKSGQKSLTALFRTRFIKQSNTQTMKNNKKTKKRLKNPWNRHQRLEYSEYNDGYSVVSNKRNPYQTTGKSLINKMLIHISCRPDEKRCEMEKTSKNMFRQKLPQPYSVFM